MSASAAQPKAQSATQPILAFSPGRPRQNMTSTCDLAPFLPFALSLSFSIRAFVERVAHSCRIPRKSCTLTFANPEEIAKSRMITQTSQETSQSFHIQHKSVQTTGKNAESAESVETVRQHWRTEAQPLSVFRSGPEGCTPNNTQPNRFRRVQPAV